jgi:hypothetical protein
VAGKVQSNEKSKSMYFSHRNIDTLIEWAEERQITWQLTPISQSKHF